MVQWLAWLIKDSEEPTVSLFYYLKVFLWRGIVPVLHGPKRWSSMNQGFKSDMTTDSEFTVTVGIQDIAWPLNGDGEKGIQVLNKWSAS